MLGMNLVNANVLKLVNINVIKLVNTNVLILVNVIGGISNHNPTVFSSNVRKQINVCHIKKSITQL